MLKAFQHLMRSRNKSGMTLEAGSQESWFSAFFYGGLGFAVGYGAAAKAVSTAEAEQKRLTICEPFLFEGYRTAEQPTAGGMSEANGACRTALKILANIFKVDYIYF